MCFDIKERCFLYLHENYDKDKTLTRFSREQGFPVDYANEACFEYYFQDSGLGFLEGYPALYRQRWFKNIKVYEN